VIGYFRDVARLEAAVAELARAVVGRMPGHTALPTRRKLLLTGEHSPQQRQRGEKRSAVG
jgi:hypothetical protein